MSSPPPPLPLLFSPIFPPFPRSPSVTVGRPLSSFLLPFSSSWTAEGGLGKTGREEKMRGQDFHGEFLTRRWGRRDASAAVGDPKNVQNGFLGKLPSTRRGQRTEREASSFPFFGAKKEEIQRDPLSTFYVQRCFNART